MLNAIIRFSLRQPLLIIALAVVVTVVGAREATQLPIDVFPDLDRPRVVVLTEAPGLPPEEVELLINFPLETALNGATGVEAVRSTAGQGISIIFVEFGWETDIYTDRQVVAERLATVEDSLPTGVQPSLAPIASIMGQVMNIGLYVDPTIAESEGREPTSMLELRELADWQVRRRLMNNVEGVAQVFAIGGEGGGSRQVQVLVDPQKLRMQGVTLHQVEEALANSNRNATGGFFEQGPQQMPIRSLGRVEDIDELNRLVIDGTRSPPVLLQHVARVENGPRIPIGLATVSGPTSVSDEPEMHYSVMLVVVKQPGADTRKLIDGVIESLEDMEYSLPADVKIVPDVYRMDSFIDRAIDNVIEALRDGFLLVVIVLFLFLLNFRTTFITLTAIPLSVLTTVLVFRFFDMSINTMTLGGLAVAIGELVDDAIVDVENIYRRLRENQLKPNPRPALRVVYEASLEVRSAIVYATMLVVLVFVPLFFLHGMEGRLFTPLGVAYIVSILASLLVSLTVTPVLCYLLLPKAKFMHREREGFLLRNLQWTAGKTIGGSMKFAWPTLAVAAAVAVASVLLVAGMGRNFLPPFNEGSVQVSVFLPPGTSLEQTDEILGQVDDALLELPDVIQVGRRTGRAEDDEHIADVNFSEILLELDPESPNSRADQLKAIRGAVDTVPGVEQSSGRMTTEQPISHLMSHMLSGVKAQIAIKIYGDDLTVLRRLAEQARERIEGTPGVVDLFVEQQTLIPQVQIVPDHSALEQYGIEYGDVSEMIETAMQGRVVSQVLEGEATFDLIVRLDNESRRDLDLLRNLAVPVPSGGSVPLSAVADVLPDRVGPNQINREDSRRRIVIQCNASGRPLSEVRDDIQTRLAPLTEQFPELGPGYFIEYGGQFESEQAATRLIGLLSLVSLVGIFLLLYSLFRSANLALQVMAALPMAAIGAVAALLLTGQALSVPAMVGFVSLAGIASRNGILLISHYLHLITVEGEEFSKKMIKRAGRERVAPVLMTALTSGIGLVPLVLAGDEPGKEILYPVATVIIGGLLSSTLLEFFVRPALFWKFGRKPCQMLAGGAGQRLLDPLADEPLVPSPIPTPQPKNHFEE